MDHCCRKLFTIVNIVTSLGKIVSLPMGGTMTNVSIHKDNAGTLLLNINRTTQFTPRRSYELKQDYLVL